MGTAQINVTNQGEKIYILEGTNVYLSGNYVSDAAGNNADATPQLVLNGTLFMTGNLTSQSGANLMDIEDSEGTLELNGSNQSIGGTSPISIYTLNLHTSNLQLLRNINITKTLQFTSGLLDLQGHVIKLGTKGSLVNETNARRIYSSGGGTVNFTIPAMPTLADELHGIGLHLDGTVFASATIQRGHDIQPNAGDGGIQRYFDVTLNTDDEIQSLQFYYFANEIPSSLTAANLAVYGSYDGGTTWIKLGGTVNTTQGYVALTDISITESIRLTLAPKDCAAPPAVDLGEASQNFCSGSTVTLDAGTAGVAYEWSTQATTQTLATTTAGTYTVMVRDARGCENTDAITLLERPTPVAAFTAPIACPNVTVDFTNTATLSSGTMTYAWNFDDPTTTTGVSTDEHPQYTYAADGAYQVQLIATSDYQCADTATQTLTVYPQPQTDFTFTNACLGQATAFTNTSTITSGGMTYDWTFGDGGTSTQANPSRTFATNTHYLVTLTATSNAGCIQAASHDVSIEYTPVAAFSVDNVCEGIAVPLQNASSITSGTLTYAWEYGDTTTGNGTTPIKAYTEGGDYTITLTAMSAYDCSHTTTQTVHIYKNPIAGFSIADNCQDQAFAFTNTTTAAEGSLSYAWMFGDGTDTTTTTPSKKFNTYGAYEVSLTATTSLGCMDTYAHTVTVYPMPVTSFTLADDCQDETFTFTNTSSIAAGTQAYHWDFGDGGTSVKVSPTTAYASADTYTITLTATSDHACETTHTETLHVYALPELDFGGHFATCGTKYTLDAGNPGSTYVWTDGSTQQTLLVQTNDTYGVTVTTAHGCVAYDEVGIVLNGDVLPHLGDDQTVCGRLTLDAGYPGSTYAWSTGETTRTIHATTTGTYTVTVTDANGCVGTDDIDVTVNPIPAVDLGGDQEYCANQQVTLDAANPGDTYQWSDHSEAQTLAVTTTNDYYVWVTNRFHCTGGDTVHITINPMPVNALPTSIQVCDTVTLNAGNAGASYLWHQGTTTRTLTVNTSGIYHVTVTTPAQCSLEFSSIVTVRYSARVDLGSDQNLCYGQTALLNAGTEGDAYQWVDGSTGTTLLARESGVYWVDVSRTNGCVRRDSVEIVVFPEIVNNLQAAYQLCVNEPRTVDASSAQAVRYAWYDTDGLISQDASITVSTPITCWVVTEDVYQCTVTDTVRVETDTDPITARFLVSSFVDVGDSVRFVDLSYPDPTNFFWDFADGITTMDTNPVHTYLRGGDFDASLYVTDPNSCHDQLVKTITVKLLRTEGETTAERPFTELLHYGLYPNPTSKNLHVGLSLNQEATIRVELYNLNGIFFQSKEATLQDDVITFDVSDLASGLYILRVYIHQNLKTLRFIKL